MKNDHKIKEPFFKQENLVNKLIYSQNEHINWVKLERIHYKDKINWLNGAEEQFG